MQVSSPESGEVDATSRKYRLASKLERTEWFLNRDASKTYSRDVSVRGTTPLRLTKEVVSICLLPQLPLLTQEGTP
jgi:hypothetical protein